IPQAIKKERSRFVDAMIDSHKYNGTGRAVIYGEPDFVCSMVRITVENGIMPIVCATGSVNKNMKQQLEAEIKKVAERYYIEHYEIMDDVDFKEIEYMAEKLGANILIGNSDGRRMEEQLNIPLVRRGFPIHDRMGGQRLRMLGYEGSLLLLDDITNVLLGRKERSFREEAYLNYFKQPETAIKEELMEPLKKSKNEIEEKTKNHPCYNGCASGSARMHLPIAPKCNVQCNYCVRKFDCPNESRPGVTTKVLTPEEAFEKYKIVKSKMKNLSVVGIAGPGDALANFEETKRTLELIRECDKDVTFCLSTNGLMLPEYANELCSIGVTHVTVTINAVDVKIGAQIYKHIIYNGVKFEGESAAAILMSNQLSGLRLLVEKGVICKVNIVMLKGINDVHIPEIVKKVNEIGCYVTNIMPFIKVEGSAFEHLPTTSNIELNILRDFCGQTMKQMYHCRQCRADAVGTLEEDRSSEFNCCSSSAKQEEDKNSLRFAVVSKSGMLVDQHFGHAQEFYIYEYTEGKVVYKEKRIIDKYCKGEEFCEEKDNNMERIIKTLHDCNGVIAARIGNSPKKRLSDQNIKVFEIYDRIEDAIKCSSLKLMKEIENVK
ncbi:MAG: nitrogenase cofactor biosynthesis protein NifB, partial [Mobilitalea sp.]